MSIWCSWDDIGWDDDCWVDMDGKPVPPECRGGEVRSYAIGWSNHYPTTDGEAEQRASVDLASIPQWCVPGHEDDYADEMPYGPWLRLSVNTKDQTVTDGEVTVLGDVYASVVMDEAAVVALRDQLIKWLDAPKVHPTEATS